MVALLMAIQSACIPIPSEVIMPLAGYALAHTQLQLILLATVASLASNLGSIPAYWVGAKGGRPMVERYGRYLLLSKRDLDMADKFFNKYGSITVLVGRMLPIVRTFISLPAGVARTARSISATSPRAPEKASRPAMIRALATEL